MRKQNLLNIRSFDAKVQPNVELISLTFLPVFPPGSTPLQRRAPVSLTRPLTLSPDQHGVITTEEDQYLIEPLRNTSSGDRDLEEAQQHVIYKMSAIPSPQEHFQEFSCGISGW